MRLEGLTFRSGGRPPSSQTIGLWLVWIMLIAAIVSLSLYPFTGWKASADLPWAFLLKPLPKYRTAFDFWTNLLAYVPLGWMTMHLFAPQAAIRPITGTLSRGRMLGGLLATAVICTGLSFLMEALQTYLPHRRAQWLDLLANGLGACLGIALCLLHRRRYKTRGAPAADLTPLIHTQLPANQLWFPGLLIILWCLAQAAPMSLWPALGNLLPSTWSIRPFAWASGTDQVFGLSAAERILTEALVVLAALIGWSFTLLQIKHLLAPHWSPLRAIGWPSVLVFGMVSACLLRVLWMRLLVPTSHDPAGLAQAIEVWLTAGVQTGLVVTALVGAAMAGLSTRGQTILVLILLLLLVSVSSGQPGSGYDNVLAQTWSQGRWFNLRGLASWSAALWPVATMIWLVTLVPIRTRLKP